MSFVSTFTEFAMMDTRTTSGALVLPLTTDIPGRIINIKDTYGAFTQSSLTIYTQGGETFEDGTNTKTLQCAYANLQVYTASTSRWYITGGTEQNMTTANISIVSTIQSFNWPSLCNNAITGYGTQFNPAVYGKISLLDNVFTSSTSPLVSSFIELGNLNAMPNRVSSGNAFRWLMGVEPCAQQNNGLDFKLKRWISFSNAAAAAYGANLSTLQDTTIWTTTGSPANPISMIHTGSFILSTLGPGISANPGVMRFTNVAGAPSGSYIQFGSTINSGAAGDLIFGNINAQAEGMRIRMGVAGDAAPGVRVGIGTNAPGAMLDVAAVARASNVSSISLDTADIQIKNMNTSYGSLKLLPSSNGGETAIAFYSTVGIENQWPFLIGRSSGFGNAADFCISQIANTGIDPTRTAYFTPDGNFGIGARPTTKLDVVGSVRATSVSTIELFTSSMQASGGIFASTVTVGTNAFSTFGTAAQGYVLRIRSGEAVKPVNNTWAVLSDARIKTNIVDANLDICYENIKNLPLRRFTYKPEFADSVDVRDRNVLGFIAQEVKTIMPKAVRETEGFGYSDLNILNIDQMNMSLVGAVKKTVADKEALESTTFGLQTLNDQYNNRISTLEGLYFNFLPK